MKDHRLYNMKHRAERDRRLSHAAHRLLAVLISDRYTAPHFMADDEFPLPWSRVREWISLEEKQCYHYMTELHQLGYLWPVALRGCPPTKFYKFSFTTKDIEFPNSLKNEGIKSIKKEGIKTVKNEGINSLQNGGHLISNPYGKNNGIKGGKGATAPGTIERAKRVSDEELAKRGRKLADAMREAADGRN